MLPIPLGLGVEISSKNWKVRKREMEKNKQQQEGQGEATMEEEEEEETKPEKLDSPTNSQQTISDDDEIDYSIKPEFYDPELDDKDELWVQKTRKGPVSDAVLSCPACFTTLCLECQRHEKYVTQYRAIFVVNCKIENKQVRQERVNPKRGKRVRESNENEAATAGEETLKSVCCSVCSTEVGVFDEDEVYHFLNVLPSES